MNRQVEGPQDNNYMVQQASAGSAEPLCLRPITPFSASCQTKKGPNAGDRDDKVQTLKKRAEIKGLERNENQLHIYQDA